jgi:phosphoribosyl-AMP cyclohydrolase
MKTASPTVFPARGSILEVEEGTRFQPKFDEHGLLPCITQDAATREILMVGYMNAEALRLTLTTRLAHYWSRSRQKLWRKGEQSGLAQEVVAMLVDDDQDALLLQVRLTGGASCHVGYRSCFFRRFSTLGPDAGHELTFIEDEKVFDPHSVYTTDQHGNPLPPKA